MPRKKPKTQTIEERERDLKIKRDKMKLLHEQRKLHTNNEPRTTDTKKQRGRIGKKKRMNEILTLKKKIEL